MNIMQSPNVGPGGKDFGNKETNVFPKVCSQYKDHGCRTTCPLSKPCVMRPGDTKENFERRMNYHAVMWINKGKV